MSTLTRGWLRGDFCLLPSGKSAKVIRNMPDGKVEVGYLGRQNDRVVIDPKLLRDWKNSPTRL